MIGAGEAALLVLSAVGVAGTVLPLLPGTALILVAAVVYAWATGWVVLRIVDVAILAALATAAYAADAALCIWGARRYGAGHAALVGASLGGLLGLALLGPLGLLLGPVAGAALGELWRGHWRRALHVGVGAGLGIALAMLVRAALATMMFAYLVWRVVVRP